MLGEPHPKDLVGIDLFSYKGLDSYFLDWKNVAKICGDLAFRMIEAQGTGAEPFE
jgi:hypothetical protein